MEDIAASCGRSSWSRRAGQLSHTEGMGRIGKQRAGRRGGDGHLAMDVGDSKLSGNSIVGPTSSDLVKL